MNKSYSYNISQNNENENTLKDVSAPISFKERIKEMLEDYVLIPPLPVRVRAMIFEEEVKGETIICYAQLLISVIFGIIYMTDPKEFVGDISFSPIPYSLFSYILFTISRLQLLRSKIFSTWITVSSIIVDVLLLMSLVWGFHIQYGQSPSYYLEAPALLAIYVFIALRTLRFDPRYVLLTGFMCIFGWLILLMYALFVTERTKIELFGYEQYWNEALILVHSELDRFSTIILVTIILALALARGRRLLIKSVKSKMAAKDLSRFFSPEIVKKIIKSEDMPHIGQAQLREAAILFIDLRGFTTLSAHLTPNDILRVLYDYQSFIVPLIKKHGGTVDKFLGDGIMITFGAIKRSEHYASQALQSVTEILNELPHWNKKRIEKKLPHIDINMGVCAGRVAVGVIGEEDRLEYTVIGETVNIAAKLEKYNKVRNTMALADEKTFQLAIKQGFKSTRHTELKNCEVIGMDHPLNIISIG